MSQQIFRDPIVTAGPTLTGVGNGTVTIDRLTHFTIEQDYTLTCIAKTPDTLFAVTGSLDGPVGIAVVGTQFYDEDLKVFFTIQQGATPFEIGDIFEFSVDNGTDLHQDNIDDYDELPQKNFGLGTKGLAQGDHNLRYLSTAIAAYRYIQDLKYTAAVAGPSSVQIQYLNPVPAVAATLVFQDLTFTATPGAAGNNISVEYFQFTPAAKASRNIQNIAFVADNFGAAGNLISIAYTAGATAGSEVVTVLSNAISVQIENGVSTAAQIKTAIDGFPAAAALVDTNFIGLSSNAQTTFAATFLLGGLDAFGEAGDEEVSISGTDIQVTLESGVSTATQVKAAIEAHPSFSGLGVTITISGVGSNPQTAPDAQDFLSGGADSYGYAGDETVEVIANLIKIYLESGVSTATQVKAAFDAFPAATALASVSIIGFTSNPQYGPMAATSLIGGKNKYFSFNHAEFSDSGSFLEGNASVRMQDAKLRGQLDVDGHATFSDAVRLDDLSGAAGPALANAQRTINELVQDEKITLGVDNDEGKLTWTSPTLSFTDDIFIDFNDTGFRNTIQSSEAPVTIADGSSAYVILNRSANVDLQVVVAALVPRHVDCFRLATRHGANLRLWDNTLIRDGSAVGIGEGGGSGSGGVIKISFIDPVSTTKPTGPSATFDGVSAVNQDLVVFTNLSVPADNNVVYEINGVGTSITYTPVAIFQTGVNPLTGDLLIMTKGVAFKNQIAEYDGTSFKVNPYARFFNGADYWELSSLQTITINNNDTDDVLRVGYVGSENMVIDYSIIRGSTKELGTIHITTDGTTATRSVTGTYIGSTGVTFQASISGADIVLEYVSDNSGSSGTMKYFVRRWSNLAGGPAGLPSYSVSGTVSAAGSSGDIQFNAAGVLGADSQFKWDNTNNIMTKAGLESSGMNGPVVLTDNQVSPALAFLYDATLYPSAIIEFSILRDGVRDTGRILISTNGTDIGFDVSKVSTILAGSGITFSTIINLGNVEVKYKSTSTGFNGSLTYAFRRWA